MILKRNWIGKNILTNLLLISNSLCYDKITLEDKIKKGLKDLEINEKYAQIKSFYEKFIDVLNDQLAKNTEQNMIIKFQLKAIMDTEERNENNVSDYIEYLQ